MTTPGSLTRQRTLQLPTLNALEPLLFGYVQEKDYLVKRTMKILRKPDGSLCIRMSGPRVMIQDFMALNEFNLLYGERNSTSTISCSKGHLQLDIAELRQDVSIMTPEQFQNLICTVFDEMQLSFMQVSEEKVKLFENLHATITCTRHPDSTKVTALNEPMDDVQPINAPDVFLIPQANQ